MGQPMLYGRRVLDAFNLMYELHHTQRRKGSGTPYITHLLGVAALVGEHGGDEDVFIAAMLHDAAEDQGGEAVLEDIGKRFGGKVAALVAGASDTFATPKPPWRERKEAHVAHMRNADPALRLLLCADKIHNARALTADIHEHGEGYWEHFKGGREGTLWYYRAACDALGDGWEHPILSMLSREVAALEKAAGKA